jgi:hypothetical protein
MKLTASFVLLLLSTSIGSSQTQPSALDSLSWLAGCWEGRYANGRTVSEQWMRPLGGLMMGMSRTVKNGKVVESEVVRLKLSDDGSVRYVAQPSGQKEASFRLVSLGGDSAAFENLEHDFPQRIIYRLVTPDSLSARIEGVVGGKPKGSGFPYRRVRCEE